MGQVRTRSPAAPGRMVRLGGGALKASECPPAGRWRPLTFAPSSGILANRDSTFNGPGVRL